MPIAAPTIETANPTRRRRFPTDVKEMHVRCRRA
jgi:hypothetical protein